MNFKVLWFQEVDSTNSHIATLPSQDLVEGIVVAAHYQKDGKGQRGSSWESNPGENLTFSLLLKPSFLEVQNQFLLSKAVSVGLCEALGSLLGEISIKWPNDIYAGNRKIAGILIENSILRDQIDQTIVGIGLNVNQRIFSDDLPNPTSMVLETDVVLDREELLYSICRSIAEQYQELKLGRTERISSQYLRLLYRRDAFYRYKTKNAEFTARIVGVKDSGRLILETDHGARQEFGFKEISFI